MTGSEVRPLDYKAVMTSPIGLLATWFGVGLSPKAPGTMGSLAALPFAWAIVVWCGEEWLLAATLLITIAGVPICSAYMKKFNRAHDPKEIVIDEVAGMWMVVYIFGGSFLYWPLAFILFRLFDIWKPWPVSWADKKVEGGLGVMLDDVLAALYAWMTSLIILVVHGLIVS
jgi:phosphatidylglycerophosphatase A